ncbi:hypothetical protein SAMN05660706_11824 [Desulfoscipio geothermicus DSM 3669]|uniref:Uncharacterized protein n=1 Tax=Desulfoscipio geothermicus DSM 3669 TaxID=1121426 RepID=A0A1I6DV08_9FIRM|nr:hypothetical protein SAMN05660706_11824 [Desulfoscipio geothermicus DSM 3669]
MVLESLLYLRQLRASMVLTPQVMGEITHMTLIHPKLHWEITFSFLGCQKSLKDSFLGRKVFIILHLILTNSHGRSHFQLSRLCLKWMGFTLQWKQSAAVISAGSGGSLLQPVMALPYHLYILFSQH